MFESRYINHALERFTWRNAINNWRVHAAHTVKFIRKRKRRAFLPRVQSIVLKVYIIYTYTQGGPLRFLYVRATHSLISVNRNDTSFYITQWPHLKMCVRDGIIIAYAFLPERLLSARTNVFLFKYVK